MNKLFHRAACGACQNGFLLGGHAMHTFHGQCQCGAVRYRVQGEVATVFACHCRECQRQSASAFGMALWVRQAQLTLLQGSLQRWQRHTPSGRVMDCDFCPQCGTRLFHRTSGNGDVLSIKPGTLDDAPAWQPVAHIWTASAQAGWQPPAGALCYLGNPPAWAPLLQAWRDHAAACGQP